MVLLGVDQLDLVGPDVPFNPFIFKRFSPSPHLVTCFASPTQADSFLL